MALIECKDCGKDISSSAANCPNCGAPISGKSLALMDGKVKFILSWAFGILLLFSGLGNIFKDGNLYGVVFILMALILLPPSVKVIEEAIGFELTLKAKGFILGGLFVSIFIMSPTSKTAVKPTSPSSVSRHDSNPISNFKMSDIYKSISGKTDLQKDAYFHSKKGHRVVWQGKVLDADSNLISSDCYVDVKPDGAGLLGSARLYVSCGIASQLNKGEIIQFDGKIKGVADVLGIHVYFDNPEIKRIKSKT